MIQTLRNVLSQLVEYFNLCEDELNNTFVGELIKQVVAAHENYDNQLILRYIFLLSGFVHFKTEKKIKGIFLSAHFQMIMSN